MLSVSKGRSSASPWTRHGEARSSEGGRGRCGPHLEDGDALEALLLAGLCKLVGGLVDHRDLLGPYARLDDAKRAEAGPGSAEGGGEDSASAGGSLERRGEGGGVGQDFCVREALEAGWRGHRIGGRGGGARFIVGRVPLGRGGGGGSPEDRGGCWRRRWGDGDGGTHPAPTSTTSRSCQPSLAGSRASSLISDVQCPGFTIVS